MKTHSESNRTSRPRAKKAKGKAKSPKNGKLHADDNRLKTPPPREQFDKLAEKGAAARPPLPGGAGRLEAVTARIDGPSMASLFPGPEDLLYWAVRKTLYVFDRGNGMWTEDVGEAVARQRLQREAENATVAVPKKDDEGGTVDVAVQVDNSTLANGIGYLKNERVVAKPPFDEDPHLCGTPEGVFDLRTLEARPGRRDEFVSQRLGVVPAEGPHPVFDDFMNWHFSDNPELHAYVSALLASFMGGVATATIAFFQGTGGSGKSTLVTLMRTILGDYHVKVPEGAFATARGTYKPGHPHWKCDLRFARVASAPEVASTHTLDDSTLNDFTGGEPIRAHKMRSANEQWDSKIKVLLYGNELPRVSANSGIRRRLRRIPIHKVPKVDDKQLGTKLEAEAPHVAWTLAKLYAERLAVQNDGGEFMPTVPDVVVEKSTQFLDQADEKRRFVNDCLELTGDHRNDMLAPKELQSAFEDWREASGLPGRAGAFGRWFATGTADAPNPPGKFKTGGIDYWTGVKLVVEEDDDQ